MSESSTTQQQFSIQKIYIKDSSFESPSSPQSFRFKKWDPKIDLNLTNKQTNIDADMYEVVLSVTATISHEDTTAFLVEVQQAGLFQIGGFGEEQTSYLLGSQCMSVLFPYAREVISDMSVRGGFPPLVMSPVNFDALYQQHLQKKQEQPAVEETEATEASEVTH